MQMDTVPCEYLSLVGLCSSIPVPEEQALLGQAAMGKLPLWSLNRLTAFGSLKWWWVPMCCVLLVLLVLQLSSSIQASSSESQFRPGKAY